MFCCTLYFELGLSNRETAKLRENDKDKYFHYYVFPEEKQFHEFYNSKKEIKEFRCNVFTEIYSILF